MSKCRNAEIKKQERKRCRNINNADNNEGEIEECLTWGIDLFTRNAIYFSLPEI
jgi:hypothetical protein